MACSLYPTVHVPTVLILVDDLHNLAGRDAALAVLLLLVVSNDDVLVQHHGIADIKNGLRLLFLLLLLLTATAKEVGKIE